ncbi:cupin domain-containing protein [Streptomyces lavendofoliae]|uniref:cupin domain-containing protein n=1 Tax=Streptomyces lavendofoliae TaxID=67314 RepID=UPI003D8ED47B
MRWRGSLASAGLLLAPVRGRGTRPAGTGDLVFLPHGKAHILANSPETPVATPACAPDGPGLRPRACGDGSSRSAYRSRLSSRLPGYSPVPLVDQPPPRPKRRGRVEDCGDVAPRTTLAVAGRHDEGRPSAACSSPAAWARTGTSHPAVSPRTAATATPR